jgi:AcrR family transcriptional regulator
VHTHWVSPHSVIDLREQLLDAAARVLEQHGPAAVTTRRIAEEAGCSEGSIYNHFANKDELLACVVSERIARFPAKISGLAATAGTGDVREHLQEIATLAVAFFRRGMPMLSFAAHDVGAVREHCRVQHEAGHGPRRTAENLAAWLRAEQALGRVHVEADPEGVASALLGSCMFHVIVSSTWGPGGPPDDPAAIDHAVNAVWRGLAPT